MGIVTKKLPYEITLRFSEGADHQAENPGEFEGAHLIERVRLVDEETGDIVGTPKGQEVDRPIPISAAEVTKVADFLGQRFVEFEADHRAVRERLAAIEKAATEAEVKAGQEKQALVDQIAARDANSAAIQQAAQEAIGKAEQQKQALLDRIAALDSHDVALQQTVRDAEANTEREVKALVEQIAMRDARIAELEDAAIQLLNTESNAPVKATGELAGVLESLQ